MQKQGTANHSPPHPTHTLKSQSLPVRVKFIIHGSFGVEEEEEKKGRGKKRTNEKLKKCDDDDDSNDLSFFFFFLLYDY